MNKIESKNMLDYMNNLLKKMNDDDFSEWNKNRNNKKVNSTIKTVLTENAANPFDTEIHKILFNNFINL